MSERRLSAHRPPGLSRPRPNAGGARDRPSGSPPACQVPRTPTSSYFGPAGATGPTEATILRLAPLLIASPHALETTTL